jgi:predicted  nucleic acid-binding Zn-ribbon protein
VSFGAPHPYGMVTAALTPGADALRAEKTCVACMNKAGELAAKNVQITELKDEAAGLREQITDLQAAVNTASPAPAEYADLHARMHRLANEEAAARRTINATEKRVHEVARERDSALRTIENLHQRFRQLGMTP